MIVRFRLPRDAPEVRELAAKFREDRFCPLGGPDGLIGFVRKVEMEGGSACVTAEISDPDMVGLIAKRFGPEGPMEIDPAKMGANNPLAGYMRARFPSGLPRLQLHVGER